MLPDLDCADSFEEIGAQVSTGSRNWVMRSRFLALSAVVFVGCFAVFTGVARSWATTSRAWHSNAGSTQLRIVALGDSDTAGNGDPTGIGWVGRYSKLLRQKLGVRIAVANLAQDGKTSDVLLSDLRSDGAIRRKVGRANVVLLGIGGADLNAGDSRHEAGKCSGKNCYAADLKKFGRNIATASALIAKLRGHQKTLLRAITLPNYVPGAQDVVPPFVTVAIGLYQAETLRAKICAAMKAHRGRCIDVLTAFNGPTGTEDAYAKGLMNHADCCYASAKGQQLIAKSLAGTGSRPVRLK
jgi:lysophospholipase L1-like esterase